jgi:hypothetical protein
VGGRGGGAHRDRDQITRDAYDRLITQDRGVFGGPSIYLADLREAMAHMGITSREDQDRIFRDLAIRGEAIFLDLEPAETWASPRAFANQPGGMAKMRRILNAKIRLGGHDEVKIIFPDKHGNF